MNKRHDITLSFIVNNFQAIQPDEDDVLASIELVKKKRFIALRALLNNIFGVGDAKPFCGRFDKETELGDVIDVIEYTLLSLYPNHLKQPDLILNEDARKNWRDTLIDGLDKMAVC